MIDYRQTRPEKRAWGELFRTTGWNEEYSLDDGQLHGALEHSWYQVSAYDGERLVGYARVISDGILHALIVEVIVAPEYQGRGIGSHMVADVVERCLAANICDIQLFCARGQAGFYERHGFAARPGEAPGMQYAGTRDRSS